MEPWSHVNGRCARMPAHESYIPDLLADLLSIQQHWNTLQVRLAYGIEALNAMLGQSVGGCDIPLAPVPQLYASFFGSFRLYRGGEPIALGRNRACLELCRYLIARAGESIARDELIELLWPDDTPARTVHRLHVTVSQLRQSLDAGHAGASIIQHDDDHYAIDGDAVGIDCQLFDRYVAVGKAHLGCHNPASAAQAFRAALALYQGDYLADHLYAEWTHTYRARYANQRLDALLFLCEYASSEESFASVADYARQILAVDNLHERAHRWLMRVHYLTGQRSCAIRQYRECAELLQRELGVTPSRQTEALYAAIRQDRPMPEDTRLFPTKDERRLSRA
jgi:DNA-binding SARP family transcriptional activator